MGAVTGWVCVHGRTDQPGYRFVCSTHWTRSGAQHQADGALRAALALGYQAHTYWVQRRRPGDVPGMWTVDEMAP